MSRAWVRDHAAGHQGQGGKARRHGDQPGPPGYPEGKPVQPDTQAESPRGTISVSEAEDVVMLVRVTRHASHLPHLPGARQVLPVPDERLPQPRPARVLAAAPGVYAISGIAGAASRPRCASDATCCPICRHCPTCRGGIELLRAIDAGNPEPMAHNDEADVFRRAFYRNLVRGAEAGNGYGRCWTATRALATRRAWSSCAKGACGARASLGGGVRRAGPLAVRRRARGRGWDVPDHEALQAPRRSSACWRNASRRALSRGPSLRSGRP